MDFIIGLPKSEGKNAIMVVVYRLTKYAQLCALSNPFNASIVAKTLIDTTQNLQGNPKTIVSDKDFTRNFFFLFEYPVGS